MLEALPSPFNDENGNDDYALDKVGIHASNWMDTYEEHLRAGVFEVLFNIVFWGATFVFGGICIVYGFGMFFAYHDEYTFDTLLLLVFTIALIGAGGWLAWMIFSTVWEHHDNRKNVPIITVDRHDYKDALQDCHVRNTWTLFHSSFSRGPSTHMSSFKCVAWTREPEQGESRFLCFRSTVIIQTVLIPGEYG